MNETLVVYLAQYQNGQDEHHYFPTDVELQLCQSAKPGSKHVDDEAGEEPEGQKIYIFFVEIVFIRA